MTFYMYLETTYTAPSINKRIQFILNIIYITFNYIYYENYKSTEL